MLSDQHYSSSIKSDGLMHNSKRLKSTKCPLPNRLLLTCKSLNEKLSDKKSMDITSRLGQFAWRQIIPSAIFLPVIFRHVTREEYLCVQMVKLHLLCRFTSESLSYCMSKCPFPQYSLTLYEAELLHYINTFHSKGTLSLNNQLCYSKLDSTSITPFSSFIKFYQFLVSTAQFTNSSQLWFSPRLLSSSSSPSSNKPITDKEKAIMSNAYDSAKNVLSKKTETNNSFCREIVFHGKEILSYCTTSSSNTNEKDHQTISCLAIKDIVSVYFPWSNIEDFIQICRKKQIIRFKPDKSTDCDSSLRLVNIQELEHHWNYILKELLPTTQAPLNYPHKSDQVIEKEPLPDEIPVTKNTDEETLTANVNIDESIKSVEPSPCLTPHPTPPAEEEVEEEQQQQQPVTDNSVSNEMENTPHLLNDIPCKINESSETMEPQVTLELSTKQAEEPEVEEKEKEAEAEAEDVSTVAEANISLENTSLKQTQRRRRRDKISSYSSKKRKRENLKTIDNEQFWLKKYSIEPFSILLDRYQLPVDD